MLGLVKSISVGVCGDAGAAAAALRQRLASRPLACAANRAARVAQIESAKKAWAAELAAWTRETDPWSQDAAKSSNAMHPRELLRELARALPADAMVSTDIGNICSVANSYLAFDRPRSMFAAMSFGNCGYAFPTIIGAKAAASDRPAIAYVGDGAWGMSFGELQTCVREGIPVTAVVFNNGQWGAEKKNHVDFYDRRFVGVNLDRQPSWAEVARAMGADGHRIDRLADAGTALRAAAAAQAEGRTTVLEMMVTRELADPFRRDALALPVRHLAKYRATAAKPR
jgi:sulfoacetaldehyde acetyltransferase